MSEEVRFVDLLGRVITKIENIKDKALVFYVENEYGNDKEDKIFYMSHSQQCCEDV